MTSPFREPPFDGPPETWPDRIVFICDGSGPPRWHVRDQEALIRALPPCAVVAADPATLTPVRLRIHAATIWLPEEVDDDDAELHRAVVGGFLDDLTTLHADVIADSPERRDLLLAALLTLRPA